MWVIVPSLFNSEGERKVMESGFLLLFATTLNTNAFFI